MMFKVLVLHALYGLADERTEFQIRDRLSFMRFVGLDLHGRVPDGRCRPGGQNHKEDPQRRMFPARRRTRRHRRTGCRFRQPRRKARNF